MKSPGEMIVDNGAMPLVRLTGEQKREVLNQRLLQQEMLMEEYRLNYEAAKAAWNAIRIQVEET